MIFFFFLFRPSKSLIRNSSRSNRSFCKGQADHPDIGGLPREGQEHSGANPHPPVDDQISSHEKNWRDHRGIRVESWQRSAPSQTHRRPWKPARLYEGRRFEQSFRTDSVFEGWNVHWIKQSCICICSYKLLNYNFN